MSIFGLVQGALMVLKLLGKIDWSWLLIFSPSIAFVGLCVIAFVAGVLKSK